MPIHANNAGSNAPCFCTTLLTSLTQRRALDFWRREPDHQTLARLARLAPLDPISDARPMSRQQIETRLALRWARHPMLGKSRRRASFRRIRQVPEGLPADPGVQLAKEISHRQRPDLHFSRSGLIITGWLSPLPSFCKTGTRPPFPTQAVNDILGSLGCGADVSTSKHTGTRRPKRPTCTLS